VFGQQSHDQILDRRVVSDRADLDALQQFARQAQRRARDFDLLLSFRFDAS
jgi:hypothetical protein